MLLPASEVMTLDDAIERVEGYALKKFHSHHAIDDLLQEARIVAWKGYQNDHDIRKICVDTRYRILDLISGKRKDQWFGHATEGKLKGAAKAGKVYGQKDGEENRARIREYLTSYTKLHDHVPSTAEIARGLGISRQTVAHHLDRLYLFTGNTEFSVTSLDTPKHFEGEEVGNSVVDNMKFGYSFEDALVDRMDTRNLMNEVLTDREKSWLYLAMYQDKTQPEIAAMYGYSRNMVSIVIRGAKAKLKSAALETGLA